MNIRHWLTRDGNLQCTVGNRLSMNGWRRTYFAWTAVCGFYRRRYYQVERMTHREVEPCPRLDEIPDSFHYKRKIKTYWRWDRTCSSCGSLSPEAFFEAIEKGANIGPTDKGYKAYVNGPAAPKVHGACKFYFQHMSAIQQKHFVDLMNAKKVAIGPPGHFYVLPYFMTKKIEKATE